jgi:hypothetical protein
MKETLIAIVSWRSIRLWDSCTPNANNCWAFGNASQSSKFSWADGPTWATPRPHCWATRVELGMGSSPPPLRRAGSDRRSPQPNAARPGNGGREVEHQRTAYVRGSSSRSPRRSVIAGGGPPTGAIDSHSQGV